MSFFLPYLVAKMWRVRRLLLGGAMIIATFCTVGCNVKSAVPEADSDLTGPIVEVLPKLEEISKIEVYGYYDQVEGKQIKGRIQVGKAYWPKLLQAMKPAREDDEGIHWQMLGFMDIETKSEKEPSAVKVVRFQLYNTYEEVGAFSIEKNEYERPYYRGGNSEALSKVLHKAYLAREEK